MNCRRLATIVIAMLLTAEGTTAMEVESPGERNEREVRLMLPAFSGEQPLGRKVATVLNLQVWQTLRRAPTPNPKKLDFGIGTVVWDGEPLPEPTFAGAEARARADDAQLVLWGRAWIYGDGVVVQPYLSIIGDVEGTAPVFWEQSFETGGETQTLRLGFPRRRYEFAPIVLRPEIVAQFQLPSNLELFASRGSTESLGQLGPSFSAKEHHGDWAQVESASAVGWVHLPHLSSERSEVVDFTGAAIRLLREDWQGAFELLQDVIDNPHTPTSLAIDARLLQAVARRRSGGNAGPIIEQAYELNPHSRVTATYGFMSRITDAAQAVSSGNSTSVRVARAHLRDALEAKRHLFRNDDPWISQVQALIDELGE